MSDLNRIPASLLQAKQGLGESYDRLNAAWQAAEEFLVSMHIGAEFHILIYEEFEDDCIEHDIWKSKEGLDGDDVFIPARHWLAFQRWGAKWGIYIVSAASPVVEPDDLHDRRREILTCPKEQRLAAASVFPEFLAKAREVAEVERARVEEAANLLRSEMAKFKLS
jgi:hypothetical protein